MAAMGQAFMHTPRDDEGGNGIFFINGISRERASLLQSQNLVWSTWIKYFGTGTKLIVSKFYLRMQTQRGCTDIVKTLITVIGYYSKVFGSGTKLVVSDKGSSSPANSEILQKKHENQIMYVCLVEKFYPEVIRVTWIDEEKEVTENVVKGDAWKPTGEDEYSIASWLTVPAENINKKYNCQYEHESKTTQVNSTENAPQEEDCSTVFNRDVTDITDIMLSDHLMHRTAYLVYIVLLLKSNMYYLIILFLIYRMRAPTKHQGKKT